jgi:uncharacterized protein (DUF4415 family)
MIANKSGLPASSVDPDDAPEWTDDQFARAEIAIGGKILRKAQGTLTRGPGRPKTGRAKEQVSVRLDQDLLQAMRSSGPGWQQRMNEMLRAAYGLPPELPLAAKAR